MKLRFKWLHALLLPALLASHARAQTLLKLSSIRPGTEKVRLLYNGDFQFQSAGPAPLLPLGWNCSGEISVTSGLNTAPIHEGRVGTAQTGAARPVSGCQRGVSLEPNTAYVLSAYIWNTGDASHHVNAVVDLNDAPQEAQIVLSQTASQAQLGYFAYAPFHTASTGTNVVVRCFYDGLTGQGAAPAFFPIAVQWDNIAITRAADFAPPQPPENNGNLRPLIRLESPAEGASVVLTAGEPALAIKTAAIDYDGTISKVEVFAGSLKLPTDASNPALAWWTNPPSGLHELSALATDNLGATTLSAPVPVRITAPPMRFSLQITPTHPGWLLSWPTSAPALLLHSQTSLVQATSAWRAVTNVPVTSSQQFQVALAQSLPQQFFRLGPEVDASTLERKFMMGYQGWFACPNDGSPPNRWVHWFRGQSASATNVTVDFWPDTRELDDDELFATGLTFSNGSPARLYSAYNQKTVVRHFQWMKENHLDGVFLQRFSAELGDPAFFALRNRVMENVRLGAETHGRVFALMYDISGQSPATLFKTLTNDWNYLVSTQRLTNSPNYLRHKGKPVLAIWGLGFGDRPGTPQEAQAVIDFFKASGVTLMGGVPTGWRTLSSDSKTASAWAAVYRSFDVLSPWAVGRYGTVAEADAFKRNQIVPDLAEARAKGLDYMPVIFPGFSWKNLTGGPLNQIPRNGGTFYWRQAYNAISAGSTMIYAAMFDEMDEGTALLKMAPTQAELPAQGTFVPLNVDGKNLPSDWYLRLSGEATKMLRQEIPLSPTLPIQP